METLLSMTFRLCKTGKLVHRINWTGLRIGVQRVSGTGMEEILMVVEVLEVEIRLIGTRPVDVVVSSMQKGR
jgi:hypothetical protein